MQRLTSRRTPTALTLACASVVALISGCQAAPASDARRPDSTPASNVVAEARTFMDTYARDLLAGNRDAIGARYDRQGTYFLGNGKKEFMTYDSVVALYRGATWAPPASFSWRDLTFEPAGPDAVVVAGQFYWGANAGGATIAMSYTAFLRRQDGVLRIRVEDESLDPTSVPSLGAAADSAKR